MQEDVEIGLDKKRVTWPNMSAVKSKSYFLSLSLKKHMTKMG
jgi:hypothetical protein